MKTKKIIYIFMILAAMLFAIETADACSLNPTAVITTDPDATVFYNDETVLLSGENSIANCGYITEYRWRVRPVGGSYTTVYQGSSPTYIYTFPLLSDGESEKVYDVELRVRNSSDKYHTSTIQVTITRDNKSFYYLTDHLGSVRVTVDERGDPVGWDDYYPFGLRMPLRNKTVAPHESPATDVKFTGYELNQEGGLGLYHAGARLYDPVVGRFMQQDPLADMYPGWSPYNYTLGNPLRFIDPDGRQVEEREDEKKGSLFSRIINFFNSKKPNPDQPPSHVDVEGTVREIYETIVGKDDTQKAAQAIISSAEGGQTPLPPDVPQKATDVLKYVQTHKGAAPTGYRGGRKFENRDGKLPSGGEYVEYDVDPKIEGVGRSGERVIVDKKTGRAWYTPDHYTTFQEIITFPKEE